jgi:acyl carrier protein
MIDEFISRVEDALEVSSGTLTPETRLESIEEFDSMGRLSVMAMVDSEYGVVLTGAQLEECQTVGDLYNLASDGAGGG